MIKQEGRENFIYWSVKYDHEKSVIFVVNVLTGIEKTRIYYLNYYKPIFGLDCYDTAMINRILNSLIADVL